MRIAVFGATGRTGVPFVRQALDAGHDVVAHARTPSKLPFSDDRLTVVEGNVYDGTGVAEAVEGADAVVSLLGQTNDGPDDLLIVAGDHVTAAMTDHGVGRYVTLVGAGVREAGESPSFSGKVMGTLLRLVAKEVLADAKEHVRRIRATDLEYTVVRAPRLVDGEAKGYRAGDIDLGFESVARADVAAFCLECVEEDLHVRGMPKVGPA
jgi:putative NADH-flavin reductase